MQAQYSELKCTWNFYDVWVKCLYNLVPINLLEDKEEKNMIICW